MRVLTGAEVQQSYEARVAYEAWVEQQTLDSSEELRALKGRHDRQRVAEWRERMRKKCNDYAVDVTPSNAV